MDRYSLQQMIHLCKGGYCNKCCFEYIKGNAVESITYRQFATDIEEAARILSSTLKLGDKVVLIGENTYLWIVVNFAVVLNHCTLIPLDYDNTVDYISSIVNRVKATAVIQIGSRYSIYLEDAREVHTPSGDFYLTYIYDRQEPSSCSYIFFTSGSTGRAKGVELSEESVFRSGYEAGFSFDLYESTYLCLPLSHIYAYCVVLLESLYKGIKIYLSSGMRYLFHELGIFQPDTIFLVPSLVESIYDLRIKKEGIQAVFGKNLRTIFFGGGMIDGAYLDKYKQYGINLLNGYGTTETCGCICMCTEQFNKKGSVGKPVLNTQFRIINEEICVKTPHIMDGYFKDSESTREAFYGKWYRTGDSGYLDEEGYLFITGRLRDIVALPNGKNIYPVEIEDEILEIDEVKAVKIRPHGKVLAAEIVPVDGREGVLSSIRLNVLDLNRRLPSYMHIQQIIFIGEELCRGNN